MRLVDDEGSPTCADEIQIGAFYTALPEGGDPEALGAGLLVVRLPAEYIHLPAGAARLGAGGHPRLLEDLPPRRLRDLAVPLSDLRADEHSSRRSPARATTRRSCPARAGGWSSARPAARCRSCR